MVILAGAALCGWLTGPVLAGTAGVGPSAGSSAGDQKRVETAVGHVRPVDPKAATILAAGSARSGTFRRLVEQLEDAEVVVYVETQQLTYPGELQLLTATPVCRYLRVSIRVPGLDNELVPWLAHELWHALEIARAPEVTDRASLLRFYSRVGGAVRADGGVEIETLAAQQVQATVLDELRRAATASGTIASATARPRAAVR